MSSFFNALPAQKKRKLSNSVGGYKKKISQTIKSKESKPRELRDESISGSDNESDDDTESLTSGSEGEEEEETAAERRLRLAERYLANIRTEVDEVGFDAEDVDRDLIAERLQEDAAESKGLSYRKLADTLSFVKANYSWTKWNSGSVTSVATCAPWAYTVSKDIGLVKWRIQELPRNQWASKRKGKKQKARPPPKRKPEQVGFVRGDKSKAKDYYYQGHVDVILAVAASQDGKYVVTGGKDRKIIVWDAVSLKCLRVFNHHRDSVTGLAFRRGSNQLYSCSKDRTIKVWSLDELAYVETLFGHQDEVVDVSALAQERCISVGARDRTARLWKVVEETQLVFRGGGGEKKKSKSDTRPSISEGSIDRVAMIDEEMFVTGSDNGSISLWAIHKKKPVFTITLCHGTEPISSLEEISADANPDPSIIPDPQPRWITALTTIPYSDVVLSGSWDGFLRAWRVSDDKKKLEAIGVVGGEATASEVAVVDINGHALDKGAVRGGEVRGVINDISVFERGERGKDGVCIVVAVGKEHRMGRWYKVQGKNGAVVFEIPRLQNKNDGVAKTREND